MVVTAVAVDTGAPQGEEGHPVTTAVGVLSAANHAAGAVEGEAAAAVVVAVVTDSTSQSRLALAQKIPAVPVVRRSPPKANVSGRACGPAVVHVLLLSSSSPHSRPNQCVNVLTRENVVVDAAASNMVGLVL